MCREFGHVKTYGNALRAPENQKLADVALAAVAFAERAPDAIDQLLRCADNAVRDPSGFTAINLAASFGSVDPALSLLLFRGCMYAPVMYESRNPMMVADEAAARIGVFLDGSIENDPVRVLHRAMMVAKAKPREDAERERERAGTNAELDELRAKVSEANKRTKELDRELDEAHAELRSRPAPAADDLLPPDPIEVRRLRAEIEELQAMIRDRNADLAALRKERGEHADRCDAGDDLETSDHGWQDIEASDARLAVPTWSADARAALTKVPAAIAREALMTVALLAAADAAAWSRVKRHNGATAPILMTRIGVNHRLLFRPAGGLLDVIELATRESLGLALMRNAR